MTRNILFSFISIFYLNAQDIEPVKWDYNVNKINDNEYNISFSASILEGWKLYSQFSPDEGALQLHLASLIIFLNLKQTNYSMRMIT